mgnify:CR=1 FL=1
MSPTTRERGADSPAVPEMTPAPCLGGALGELRDARAVARAAVVYFLWLMVEAHIQNGVGLDAEIVQAHTKQQACVAGVAGHFAAHAGPFAFFVRRVNDVLHEAQDGWVVWLVEIRDRFVHAVGCHRVLDQVVRADGEEVGLGGQLLGGLVVTIGSKRIDASIRTRLNSLSQAMKA